MNDDELELVRVQLAQLRSEWKPHDVAEILRRLGYVVSDSLVFDTVEALRHSSVGAGRLEPLLATEGLTDILVNGPDQVYIDRGRGLEKSPLHFDSEEEVRRLAVRLAAGAGKRLDEACPYVDARLANGIRLHAVLDILAEPGTCISLRIPSKRSFSLDDWVSNGSIDEFLACVLKRIIDSKVAFLISGGTGSGKTTLMASLLSMLDEGQRLVIVEDSRELNPDHRHCIKMEARQPNNEGAGAVTMTDLVKQALRMRPDRLVLGEVRGAELCDLLTALNTGHEGGCGTVHANSVEDLPARLEALGALGGMERTALHAQLCSALRVVIQVSRLASGKRTVTQIGLLKASPDRCVYVSRALFMGKDGRIQQGDAWEEFCDLIDLDKQTVGS